MTGWSDRMEGQKTENVHEKEARKDHRLFVPLREEEKIDHDRNADRITFKPFRVYAFSSEYQ